MFSLVTYPLAHIGFCTMNHFSQSEEFHLLLGLWLLTLLVFPWNGFIKMLQWRYMSIRKNSSGWISGNSRRQEPGVLAWKQVPILLFAYRQPELLRWWTGEWKESFNCFCLTSISFFCSQITCLASMAKTGQADTGKVQEAIVAKFGAPDSPYQVLWATTFLTIVVLYTCPALTSMYICPALTSLFLSSRSPLPSEQTKSIQYLDPGSMGEWSNLSRILGQARNLPGLQIARTMMDWQSVYLVLFRPIHKRGFLCRWGIEAM